MPGKRKKIRSPSEIGKVNRRNGKVWEREVTNYLKKVFGPGVRRGYQSRQGSDEADVTGIDKVWVECKSKERFSLKTTYDQCLRDMDKSGGKYKGILIFARLTGTYIPGTRKFVKLSFYIPTEEDTTDHRGYPLVSAHKSKIVSAIYGEDGSAEPKLYSILDSTYCNAVLVSEFQNKDFEDIIKRKLSSEG